MKKSIFYLALPVFVLASIAIKAQTDTEFWFVKPNITQEHTAEDFKIGFTTREFAADVTIVMPAEPLFTPVNISVPAFTTSFYTVLQASPEFPILENTTVVDELSVLLPDRDNIGNKAILVTSTAPINAYLTQTAANNSDIYALKGGNGIGTEFIIPFQEHAYNQHDAYGERAFSSIEIISFEDGTVVRITPPAGRSAFRNGMNVANQNYTLPFTVTLNRGQVYTCPPGWDPTVTRNNTPNSQWWGIEGNQRLGGIIVEVITGTGVAVVKKDDSARKYTVGGWDIIADQWVPYKGIVGDDNDILGTEYVAMRGGLDAGWEFVYVAAPENNTRIWWGNVDTNDVANLIPDIVINRGQQVGIPFDNAMFVNNFMEIISNKPLSVLHVSGRGMEMGGAVLPPISKCTGSTSVSFARDMSWPFYLNIMARAGAEDDFLVDGVPRIDIIDPLSFVPVGSTGDWVATQIFYPDGNVVDFPVGVTRTISNTEDVFHLGLINGNNSGGCRFGYFSDFNEIGVSANTIQGDGSQPSSTIRACQGDTVQLFAAGGSTFSWWPSTNLSNTTISNPTAVVDAFRTYFVEVSGACNNTDTATVTIEMAKQPEGVFFLEKAAGCAPLELEIRNLSTDVNQIYWDYNVTGIGGGVDRDTTKYHPSIITDVDSVFRHTFYNTSFEPIDSAQVYHVQLKVKATKCVDTINTTVTIYPEVTADFTLLDWDDTLSCNPAEVDFEASVLSINEDYYKWRFGDGALSATGDTTHNYFNIHTDQDTTYTAQLVVRSDWFCRDTAYQDFTVYSYLEGGFAIDKDKGCNPFIVNITNLSSGADTIFLDFGDGTDTTMTTFTTINHFYENNDGVDEVDTNIIIMRVKNDEGCEFIDRDTIIVYPEVIATYTIDPYNDCNSDSVTFNNNSNLGIHIASKILWTFGDGINSNSLATQMKHFYNNTSIGDQTYTFDLHAESDYGCFDDTSNTITMYRAYADFYVDTVEGCSPIAVNLVNNSIGTNIANWSWDYGDAIGTSPLKNPPTYTYNNTTASSDTNKLVLEATHVNGTCFSRDSVNMVVHPEMDIVSIAPIGVIVCDSTVVDFTSTIFPALAGINYSWSFGDGASSSNPNPSHLYRNQSNPVRETYNVSLDAVSDFGCADNAMANVFVDPYVQASFSVNVSEGCSPLDVVISNNSNGGTYRYYWNSATAAGAEDYLSNNPLEVRTQRYVNNTGADLTFYLTLIAQYPGGGCADTLTREILVHSSVKAEFVSLSGLANCSPFTVNFDNQTNPLSDASYFIWDFDDGTTGVTNKLSPDTTHVFVNYLLTDKTFKVKLEAESTWGCTHDTTLDIMVYSNVTANFSVPDNEGCPIFTSTINNTSLGHADDTYEWWVDGGLVASSPTTSDFTYDYDNLDHLNKKYYQVKLIAENTHNCTSEHIDTITVYEEVAASFDVNVDRGCSPLTISFTDMSLVPSSSTYNWDFDDGATSGSKDPIIYHEYNNSSRITDISRTVQLIVRSPSFCSDTITDDILVYHKPLSRFDVSRTSDCPPLITNVNKDSEGDDIFQWRFGDGVTSNTAEDTTYTYLNTKIGDVVDNYTLELWVGTANGCKDSTDLVLSVFPQVDVDFDFNAANLCSPVAGLFVNNSSDAAKEFYWDFDDGTTSNQENPAHEYVNTWDSDRTYKVYLRGESEYDCRDTITKLVTVYVQPYAEFETSPIVQKYPLSKVSIDNKSNMGPFDYLWEFGDLNNSTYGESEPQEFQYEHWGEYDIALTINSQTHNCSDSTTKSITILPPDIKADFTPSIENACADNGVEVEFTAAPSIYAEVYDYFWDFDDGESGTGEKISHFYEEAGSYYVKMTATGLGGEDYKYRTISVFENPVVNFDVLPKESSLDPVTLKAQVKFFNKSECSDTVDCAYLWEFGDGTTSISTDITHYYEELGFYDIKLTAINSNGCTDSLLRPEEVEVIGGGKIIFPNAFTPNGDELNNAFVPAVMDDVLPNDYELLIYNRWGELLFKTNDLNEGWDGRVNRKPGKSDVYVWKARGKFTSGRTFEMAGDVTLIR